MLVWLYQLLSKDKIIESCRLQTRQFNGFLLFSTIVCRGDDVTVPHMRICRGPDVGPIITDTFKSSLAKVWWSISRSRVPTAAA